MILCRIFIRNNKREFLKEVCLVALDSFCLRVTEKSCLCLPFFVKDDITNEEPSLTEKHKNVYGPVMLSLCQVQNGKNYL